MARRVPVGCFTAALIAVLAATPLAGQEEERAFSTLAEYGFEGRLPDAGPDTFRVFELARGRVAAVDWLRFRGARSVEIRDVALDGDFPELQGYFDLRRSGQVVLHFAFLTPTPNELWNAALAGPRGFSLEADGIALWLGGREGWLVHVSDSIPRRIVPIEPFTWYLVDVFYDVARGRYDLAVRKEGGALLATLGDQPNVTRRAGSAIDKFSFIGDRGEDLSNVVYYVDDVVIGADEHLPKPSLVAPGRRALFLETRALGPAEGGEPPGLRLERAGDRAFAAGDLEAAQAHFTRALEGPGADAERLWLKLADLAFLSGDPARERSLRERVYGTLDPDRKAAVAAEKPEREP
jgi:hypothetical protein